MNTVPVRVMLTDVWDDVHLQLPADMPLAEMKRQVLELNRVADDPEGYVVKFRGAQISDENKTLAELGVPRNAALIMLPRRRQPVR